LEDASGSSKDDIQVELERISSTSDVDAELARLKTALPPGRPPQDALTAGPAQPPEAQS